MVRYMYNCDFEVSVVTFTREMDVGRQKLC